MTNHMNHMNHANRLDQLNHAIDPTPANRPDSPESLELLREIRDELRDFNKDMDRLNALTEEQVVSTVQNRKVAAITLMFVIPSTFAAIPGANFEHLNEYGFDNFYALPVLLGAVVVSALATFAVVKKKGWL
ncbi:hypothetical protein ACH4SP_35505 [Streptomyces sp. NPDC021093]|uniref:hypothetical protein n=1 Tax=Streptomyces sp. NPDC021093 TaxID=3365112 RepID=UPI0037906A44